MRCIVIAKKHWLAGDKERAVTWLEKSLRMKESEEAERLLRIYTEASPPSPTPSPRPAPAASSPRPTPQAAGKQARPRTSSTSSASSASSAPSSRGAAPAENTYNAEEHREALDVIKEKDFYRRLGVDREAFTPQLLAKAYRKRSLKFHPDKNRSPLAEAAMKAVNQAYECLKDPTKKRIYDQTGSDNPDEYERRQQQHTTSRTHRRHEFDDVENLFQNVFFGAHARRRQRADAGEGEQQQNEMGHLVLPFIMLLLLVTLLFNPGMESRESYPFSLNRDGNFRIRRTTPSNTEYFVSRSFDMTYGRDRHRLSRVETLVDQQYVEFLTKECQNERKKQKDLVKEAKRSRGQEQAEKLHHAFDMQMERCEQLAAFG